MNEDIIQLKQCKGDYELKNGTIQLIKNSPISYYNPFDLYNNNNNNIEKSIYVEFVSIDENNEKEILKFIKKYGFLGINSLYRKDICTDMTNLHLEEKRNLLNVFHDILNESLNDPDKFYSESKNILNKTLSNGDSFYSMPDNFIDYYFSTISKDNPKIEYEEISKISEEIKKMRRILLLYLAIKSEDVYELHDLLKTIDEIILNTNTNIALKTFPPEFLKEYKYNFLFLLKLSKTYIANEVNKEIFNIKPYITFEANNTSFDTSWAAPDLLSTMYTMIYLDLMGGKLIKKCENETCNKYFYICGNDKRKKYCTTRCGKTQAQREYRRRKKAEKEMTTLDQKKR